MSREVSVGVTQVPFFFRVWMSAAAFFRAVGGVGFVGDLFPRAGVAIFFGLDEAGTELGFLRGKRQRKSAVEKMFDAAHAGVAGFDGADFKGQVADEGNVLLF